MSTRWKSRELRRRGLCRCGKGAARPGQRDCCVCHRAAMKALRDRQKAVTAMRLRVLEYLANNGVRGGLPPALVEVCEMARSGHDPFLARGATSVEGRKRN